MAYREVETWEILDLGMQLFYNNSHAARSHYKEKSCVPFPSATGTSLAFTLVEGVNQTIHISYHAVTACLAQDSVMRILEINR